MSKKKKSTMTGESQTCEDLPFMKNRSSLIGGVLKHSFAIDVKGREKKNIAINNKGGDC